ncbi:MAG: DUF262 domain-containing protein [Sulfuricurvum sp.]
MKNVALKIDLYGISDERRKEQLRNNEDIRFLQTVPFDKKYQVKKFPTGLCKLIELGVQSNERNHDKYIVPEYQRDLVWSLENKQNLIYAIMNGSPIGEFIFARDTIDTKKDYHHEWRVIDGQQRINALREFIQNLFSDKDGRFYGDYSYREMVYLFEDFDDFSAVYIQDLSNEDQVKIYISKNVGGVAHTQDELQKARTYLANLERPQAVLAGCMEK